MASPVLTVVVLTLNEADRIERCLASVPANTRVVVLDSFSNDGTLERARECLSRLGRSPGSLALVQKSWLGFVQTRNESLKWVETPWVLWLDADEWITPALTRELEKLDTLPTDTHVYRMPRLSEFLGRPIRHGGWYPDRKRRLARARHCEWRSGPNNAQVHEDLWPLVGERIGDLHGDLGHVPFRDTRDQQDTNDRYSSLLAEGLARKLKAQGRSAPAHWFIRAKIAIKFVENYFWKLGCLDGRAGLVIALGSAQSLRMRLEKTRLLMEKI